MSNRNDFHLGHRVITYKLLFLASGSCAASSRRMQHVPARNTRSTHPFHYIPGPLSERDHLHIISEYATSHSVFELQVPPDNGA